MVPIAVVPCKLITQESSSYFFTGTGYVNYPCMLREGSSASRTCAAICAFRPFYDSDLLQSTKIYYLTETENACLQIAPQQNYPTCLLRMAENGTICARHNSHATLESCLEDQILPTQLGTGSRSWPFSQANWCSPAHNRHQAPHQ